MGPQCHRATAFPTCEKHLNHHFLLLCPSPLTSPRVLGGTAINCAGDPKPFPRRLTHHLITQGRFDAVSISQLGVDATRLDAFSLSRPISGGRLSS
jgi:hypothetical protein